MAAIPMRPLIAGLFVLTLCPFVVRADDPAPDNGPRARQTFALTDENDFWGKWSDKYYTNGMAIAWTAPDWFTGDPTDPAIRRLFFSAGQEMYTPKNTGASDPPASEYPYSGLTYLSGGYAQETGSGALYAAELRLGIIGPSSLAQQTARMWHIFLNDAIPAGWDTQMPNEPAFNFVFEHRRRFILSGRPDSGWACDLIPRGVLEGGNIRTEAVLGVQFRTGYNLPADYGHAQMRQSTAFNAPTLSRNDRACYAFFDLQAEAVAYNYSLDGTAFDSSRSVTTIPCVGQAMIGVTARWDDVRFTFFQSIRTREFTTQDKAFVFGGVSLSVDF